MYIFSIPNVWAYSIDIYPYNINFLSKFLLSQACSFFVERAELVLIIIKFFLINA